MNRYFINPGWNEAPLKEQQTIWVKYVRNLYSLFARLRNAFPEIILENCAAGNGRSDVGMSYLFGRSNRSDNQDPLDVLRLHEGFTWLHPAKAAGGGCHISDFTGMVNGRNVPVKFQAFTGMMGSLALGCNLRTCNAEKLEELRYFCNLYKKIRPVVHLGTLYRLISHYNHPYAAFEYVSPDKKEAVLFVLGHSIQFAYKVPPVRLQGLDPDMKYELEIYGNNPITEGFTASIFEYVPMTGNGLMEIGVRVELSGDFDAKIIHLTGKK